MSADGFGSAEGRDSDYQRDPHEQNSAASETFTYDPNDIMAGVRRDADGNPEAIAGRGGETPRERSPEGTGTGAPAPSAAPARPSQPSPSAGAQQEQPAPTPQPTSRLIPFTPMGGSGGAADAGTLTSPGGGLSSSTASIGSSASPQLRSLFGSQGGLRGGGLGVPLDPVSNQMSDPISLLIEQLMKQSGGL